MREATFLLNGFPIIIFKSRIQYLALKTAYKRLVRNYRFQDLEDIHVIAILIYNYCVGRLLDDEEIIGFR